MSRFLRQSGVCILFICGNWPATAGFAQHAPFRLEFATYLGGQGQDGSREAALGPYGNYICAGDTASRDFPVRNAFDSVLSGTSDGFVARFAPHRLISDLNGDGTVDFRDFSLLAEQWLDRTDDGRTRSRGVEP